MFGFTVKNFRSFKNQHLEFSKVNILIGENSSGKSSLLKFFLMLKQSLELPHRKESNIALSGEYSDLGNYQEAIYYNNEELPLEFEFSFKEYDKFFRQFIFTLSPDKDYSDRLKFVRDIINSLKLKQNVTMFLSFCISKDLNNHSSIKTSIKTANFGELEIFPNEKDSKVDNPFFGPECSLKYTDLDGNIFFLDGLAYEKKGFLTLIQSPSLEKRVRAFLKKDDHPDDEYELEFKQLFYKIAYFLIAQNLLELNLENIEYVNPLQTSPSRIYLKKDVKESSHINDIDDFVNFFAKETELSKTLLPEFIELLKEFGLLNSLEIISDDRLPVRELRVKIGDLYSNISDVGYGVALQLPIILKCFLAETIPARQGSVIIIEQPEVHLHPKLHAKFMELILKLSTHTTYFIETHSEHIIRKLQVAVKQKEIFGISPDEISIHYLIRNQTETIAIAHKIEATGKLTPPFTSGFFDNSYLLTRELLD